MPRFFIPLLIVSIITCCIEVEVSVPGFPEIASYFKVSDGAVQLTVAYNFLGFCLSSLVYGPLSEGYGRRKVMIAGNALLLLGALGCVLASSMPALLASRFVQGIGASTSAVVVFAMIADCYQGERAAKLIGVINSVLTSLMALAPVLGGFINEWLGWRGNYACVAALSLLSWVLLLMLLPETKHELKRLRMREIGKDFKALFSNPIFIASALTPSLLYSAYLSFVACASFLYMETFGLSIIAYALHQAVIVASFAVTSLFSGAFIQKLGGKGCVVLGMGTSLMSAILMVGAGWLVPHSPYAMTVLMTLFCIGFAISYPVIFASSLEIFPGIKGTASSAIMSMRALLSFALIGLMSYLYDGRSLTVSLVILLAILIGSIFAVQLLKANQFEKKMMA